MRRFIVWIKERGCAWEPNGEGELSQGQADRIARETRVECYGVRVAVLPIGAHPLDLSRNYQQQSTTINR